MNRPIFDFCEIFTIYILDGTVLNAEIHYGSLPVYDSLI